MKYFFITAEQRHLTLADYLAFAAAGTTYSGSLGRRRRPMSSPVKKMSMPQMEKKFFFSFSFSH